MKTNEAEHISTILPRVMTNIKVTAKERMKEADRKGKKNDERSDMSTKK